MKALNKLVVAFVACSSLSVLLLSEKSFAGEIIFDDQANMKISRLITKARVLKNTRGKDVVENDPSAQAEQGVESIGQVGCGGIDIANQAPPRPGRAPRTTEVFILGDVINANNKCN